MATTKKALRKPEDMLWLKLLKEYRNLGGVGLSPTALIHLSGTSWPVIRRQFMRLAKEKNALSKRLGVVYCHGVRAQLLVYSKYGGDYDLYTTNMLFEEQLAPLDQQTEKWPGDKYAGVHNDKGTKTFTCDHGNNILGMLENVVKEHKANGRKAE